MFELHHPRRGQDVPRDLHLPANKHVSSYLLPLAREAAAEVAAGEGKEKDV